MKQLTINNIKDLLNVPGIYHIKISDKSYIGSSVSIGHRLKHHLWALTTGKHHNRTMQNMFNKYTVNMIFFEKIEECLVDDLIEREKYYIDTLVPYMNHILDPCKIVRSDIYKKRLSEGLKKAYTEGLRPHNDKSIHQYNKDGQYVKSFSTVTAASKFFTQSGPTSICNCARGVTVTAYGFRWSYEKLDKLPDFTKKYKLQKVEQYNLNEEFVKEWKSITEAEQTLSITNISRAIKHYPKREAGGFLWRHKS